MDRSVRSTTMMKQQTNNNNDYYDEGYDTDYYYDDGNDSYESSSDDDDSSLGSTTRELGVPREIDMRMMRASASWCAQQGLHHDRSAPCYYYSTTRQEKEDFQSDFAAIMSIDRKQRKLREDIQRLLVEIEEADLSTREELEILSKEDEEIELMSARRTARTKMILASPNDNWMRNNKFLESIRSLSDAEQWKRLREENKRLDRERERLQAELADDSSVSSMEE